MSKLHEASFLVERGEDRRDSVSKARVVMNRPPRQRGPLSSLIDSSPSSARLSLGAPSSPFSDKTQFFLTTVCGGKINNKSTDSKTTSKRGPQQAKDDETQPRGYKIMSPVRV